MTTNTDTNTPGTPPNELEDDAGAERGWDLIAHYASRHDHDTRDDDEHRAVTVELIADVLRAVERFTGWNTAEVYAEALELGGHDG